MVAVDQNTQLVLYVPSRVSTLRSHIEAMVGELDVLTRFPDETVKISIISDLGKAA